MRECVHIKTHYEWVRVVVSTHNYASSKQTSFRIIKNRNERNIGQGELQHKSSDCDVVVTIADTITYFNQIWR